MAKLEIAVGSQSKAYDHAGDTSSGESHAIDEAKSFIRRLRNALPRALRETPSASVTFESFHAGLTLGRSTPKISKYLAEIRPGVATLDIALAKHFKGQLASIELDMLKTALDQADTAQELARVHAPGETLALYEVMGQVLEQIEDLNRAGKIAFDADGATRAKFNKDILLRARKERPKKAKKDEGAAPPLRRRPPVRPPRPRRQRPFPGVCGRVHNTRSQTALAQSTSGSAAKRSHHSQSRREMDESPRCSASAIARSRAWTRTPRLLQANVACASVISRSQRGSA